MNRIKINEIDSTSNLSGISTTEVVYVPGFSATTITSGMAAANTPTLCRTLTEFQTYFGTKIPTFTNEQKYPVATTEVAGFTTAAIPTNVSTSGSTEDAPMFLATTADPGYTMAYELLSNGIYVVFERMNEDTNDSLVLYEIGKAYTEGIYLIKNSSDAIYKVTTAITADANTSWDAISSDVEEQTNQVIPISVKNMYTNLSERFSDLSEDNVLLDKGAFSVKYITSGGYPVFEYGKLTTSNVSSQSLMTAMLNFCGSNDSSSSSETTSGRCDCFALIDHTDNQERKLYDEDTGSGTSVVYGTSVFAALQRLSSSKIFSYGAMFTPWCSYATESGYTGNLPASYGYLLALINATKSNPVWLPVAGTARGYVPNISSVHTNSLLTNTIAEKYQRNLDSGGDFQSGMSLNAITYINSVGYCIWGNRTMYSYVEDASGLATTFLNLRNLACDIKKQVFAAAQQCMFEQNNDILWTKFKNKVSLLADQMVSANVLSGYTISKAQPTSRTKLIATITVYPIYSIENIQVNIVLTDEDTVTVS